MQNYYYIFVFNLYNTTVSYTCKQNFTHKKKLSLEKQSVHGYN